MVKSLLSNAGDAGDMGSIPGWRRSPGGGSVFFLVFLYSFLENPMARGTWQATVDGVAKRWTRLSMHTHAKPPPF